MTDAMTDNRSQPDETPLFVQPSTDVKVSVARREQFAHKTLLGIGLPADTPVEYMRVHVDLDRDNIVLVASERGDDGARKLPVRTKDNSPRRWLHIGWDALGVADPQEAVRGIEAANVEVVSCGKCLRIQMPHYIASKLRQARDKAAEQVKKNAVPTEKSEPSQQPLQDLRDARDMLNQALIDAEKAGYEIETRVVSNRVKLAQYVREERDL